MSAPSSDEMLSILVDRANKVMDYVKRSEKARDARMGRFLAGIANLIDQAKVGQVSAEEWQDHELAWQAHVARVRSELVARTSKVMLAFEAMAKYEPEKITPEIAKQLYWWQNEGGRELFLGELPIEQRRELERAARKRS